MGHSVEYQITVHNVEDYNNIWLILAENELDFEASTYPDNKGGEFEFKTSHSYTFSWVEWFKDNVSGAYTIEAYYQKTQPDEVHINVK